MGFHYFNFCQIAEQIDFDNNTLKSLFWVGANFHYPCDLPDLKEGKMKRSSSPVSAVGLTEQITSGTATAGPYSTTQPSPEPSQPPSMTHMDYKPEPTADRELMLAMDPEPEPMPTKKPEPQSKSEKVCEAATS